MQNVSLKNNTLWRCIMKGYNQGNMKPEVKSMAKPSSCYTQKYSQTPLNYIERQNKRESYDAKKLRGEAHMGRYGS